MAAPLYHPLLQLGPASGARSLGVWLGLAVGVGVLAFVALAVTLWLLLGRGPRLRRGLARAQRLLRAGQWQEALGLVHGLQPLGRGSKHWEGRLRFAEGECYQA